MSVRKLAVPDVNAANLLVFHSTQMGCCGEDGDFCKFVAEAAAITNVTAFTINVNGTDIAVTLDAAVSTPKDVRKAISLKLKEQGYDPYYHDNYKGVQVLGNQICVIGEVKMVDATINGAVVAFQQRCNMTKICKFQYGIAYDTQVGALTVDGVAGTAIGGAAGYAAGAAATLKTDLEAALTADGVVFTATEVEETEGMFLVTIHLQGEPNVALGTTAGVNCGCYPDFVA